MDDDARGGFDASAAGSAANARSGSGSDGMGRPTEGEGSVDPDPPGRDRIRARDSISTPPGLAVGATEPLEVGPTEDGRLLRIRWRDGHVSEFPPRHIRLNCRCAGCQDEFTGQRTLNPAAIPEEVYPLAIQWAGRYALRFNWSDGHDTGIFPFELLRGICPCGACGWEAG